MRTFSKKRQKQNRQYSKLRKEFLEGKECVRCGGEATQVHHAAGRVGNNFLDVSTWVPVCHGCHQWIELHPIEAKQLGFSKSRLSI